MRLIKIFVLIVIVFSSVACKTKKEKTTDGTNVQNKSENSIKHIKSEDVNYSANGKNYKSFVAYNEVLSSVRPVVIVIPEWWGLNEYAKNRATQLAELGYFAMAVDYYGEGKVVDNPNDAEKLATPFYNNPQDSKSTFDAALDQIKNFKNADISKVAVIGYCFGGSQALNMARQEAGLKGVVSFHGNLMTGVKPNNNSVKILVCNGEDDTFVSKEEINAFKKEMDSAKIDYTFINYPKSLHSFTNPDATNVATKYGLKIGYNKEADEKSWIDMKAFFEEIFK